MYLISKKLKLLYLPMSLSIFMFCVEMIKMYLNLFLCSLVYLTQYLHCVM